MKCLIIDEVDAVIQERLSKHMEVTWRRNPPSEQEMTKLISEYDILVMRVDPAITKKILDAAKKLKIIAIGSVGINHIDMDYAAQKGIKVFNSPGLNIDSVAELTIGYLINISRQITKANNYVKMKKQWNKYLFMGRELACKTIGIIGYGRIGQRVGQLAQAFKMDVIAYDPYITVEQGRTLDTRMVTFEELLKESDYITIHVPLIPETKNMISYDQIRMLKTGSIIVNMGRGGVVDEEAIAEALQSGKIRGAGMDVMSCELNNDFSAETIIDSPLMKIENFIITPHIGGQTYDSQKKIGNHIVENIERLCNIS